VATSSPRAAGTTSPSASPLHDPTDVATGASPAATATPATRAIVTDTSPEPRLRIGVRVLPDIGALGVEDPQARARAGAAATPPLTTPQLDIITFALLWYLRGRGRSAIPSLWTNSWPGDVLPYFGLVESQNRICQHTSINTLFKTGVYMYTEVLDTCKAWLDNPLFRAAGLRALSSTASPCPLTAVPRPACPPLSVALAAAAAQSPLAASLAVIQQRKSFSGVVIQLGLI
jgi:hypothetical protein